MTKPFHPDELDARINVLLRRFDRITPAELIIQHLRYYPKMYQLINWESKEEITLTSKQLKIFDYFLMHAGQVLTKEQIYEAVWEESFLEGGELPTT